LKIFSRLVLVLYFLFLTWLILFKLSPNLPAFIASAAGRSLNLVPFAGSGGLTEIALNVVAFVPYGGLLVVSMGRSRKFAPQLLIAAITSVSYEVLQYIFAVGATDITDVMTNVLGALLGIGIVLFSEKLVGRKTASFIMICLGLIMILGAVLVSQTGLLGLRIRFK
jgi:glycopeptide antibiotics resistance protein